VGTLLDPLKDPKSSTSKDLTRMHAQAAQLVAEARKQAAR